MCSGTVGEPATGPVFTGGVAAQMRVKDAVGRFGEQTAARHLTAAGLTILDRNWRPAAAPEFAASSISSLVTATRW